MQCMSTRCQVMSEQNLASPDILSDQFKAIIIFGPVIKWWYMVYILYVCMYVSTYMVHAIIELHITCYNYIMNNNIYFLQSIMAAYFLVLVLHDCVMSVGATAERIKWREVQKSSPIKVSVHDGMYFICHVQSYCDNCVMWFVAICKCVDVWVL